MKTTDNNKLLKAYDDTCSYCGESHPQYGAICPTYEQHKADDAQAEKETPMKTTDNTIQETEFPVRMSIKLANYYYQCEAQRDAAVAALRGMVTVFNVKDIDPLQAFVAIEQAQGAIAATQGS